MVRSQVWILSVLLFLVCFLAGPQARADVDIQAMIGSITEGDVATQGSVVYYLEGLLQAAGNQPRVTGTPVAQAAAQWIFDQYDGMNYYNVTMVPWSALGYTDNNVVAELAGTDPTSDLIYIVCAHYDSREISPGADDNGSGTAGLLATAWAIKEAGLTFPHTIRFIAFSGEEQGELGSGFYASAARQADEKIAAVLSYDMAGYYDLTIDPNSDTKVRIYENYFSQWLTQFLDDVSNDADYSSLINLDVVPTFPDPLADNHPASDHQSFWNQFYCAIGLHEQVQNPNYHQPTDTIANMIPEYSTRVSRLAAASLAEAARYGVGEENMPQDFACLAVLPVINGVTPSPAVIGQSVLITGINFSAPPCLYDVTFEGVSTPHFTWIDDNTIEATVPTVAPGPVGVRVHIHVGGTSEPYTITVALGTGSPCVPMLTPLITGISPNPAEVGREIWIDGGFQPEPCTDQVVFIDSMSNETDANFTWLEPSTIVAQVPPSLAPGMYNVKVVQANGEMTSLEPIQVVDNGAVCLTVVPVIDLVTPPAAPPCTPVTIVGRFLQPPGCLYDVTFGGVSSPFWVWLNYNMVVALVPAISGGPAPVQVHINGGGLSNSHAFEVVSVPFFKRGDCNGDGQFNIADAVALLSFLFPMGPPFPVGCEDSCDANDDGQLNIGDPIAVLGVLFAGDPPLPGQQLCGVDCSEDDLGCETYSPCP